MRRPTIAAGLLAASLVAGGCGGSAGDLLAINVTGGAANIDQRIVIQADGRATCNAGTPQDIGSDALIDAREIERESDDLARRGAVYDARKGDLPIRSYVLRSTHGEVRWQETAKGLPEVLAKGQLLTLQLGRKLC